MKDAAADGQPTAEWEAAEQEATVQKTSLLALSRRSRRAGEHSDQRESGVETAEFAVPAPEAGDADASAEDAARSERTAMSEGAEESHGAASRRGFKHWRRQRPLVGGVLAIMGGVELFFSGQLDLGNMQIQFGIEGLQATVLPIVIVVLALLAIFRPTHHVFYGIIGLVLAVYSLIGVNLGGFLLGMLLSTVGMILVTAWMGPREAKSRGSKSDGSKSAPTAEGNTA